MKSIRLLFLVLIGLALFVLPVIATADQEFKMNSFMKTLNLPESTSIIDNSDCLVDYVMNEVRSEFDMMLQLQTIMVACQRIAPETTMTVVKARYTADTDPLLVAAVPTEITKLYLEDKLTPQGYWQFVVMNDPALIEDVQGMESGSSSWWKWLFGLIIIGLIAFFVVKKVSTHGSSKSNEKEKHVAHVPEKHMKAMDKIKESSQSTIPHSALPSTSQSLFGWSHSDSTRTTKIVALVCNILLPGLGYFFLNSILRKKAVIFTLISIVLHIISGYSVWLFVVFGALWLYTLVDVGRLLRS